MTTIWEAAALLILIAVTCTPVVRVKRTWSDAPDNVRRFTR